MPSETKPSTDQVLTNTLIGFGRFERWVSRSAMWMPLTPSLCASSPQPSRLLGSLNGVLVSRAMSSSACLTNHDTMPGLAPQVETAAVSPGLLWFAARKAFPHPDVGLVSGAMFLLEDHGSQGPPH